ncbi:hypothetical protein KIMH_08710 [Bombiscardovia apis]|uniref:RCC1-like domain-containing protein n=1 Tax=Bombiscardovia apis TaxID=2932182 RepID=A0ABM8BCY2_9BIFI|nr:InlB B-repeat-containing protein [Bombiscardovia apis]BDR54760.1 hypothetical protein KIMH_08710 [Bombiscardovia apis]
MRRFRLTNAMSMALVLIVLGGGAIQLAQPAHADPTQLTRKSALPGGSETVDGVTLSPTHGPISGGNQATVTKPPANVSFTQVSAGNNSAAAIGSDGFVYWWGENKQWAPVRAHTPTGVRFTQISAGYTHYLALSTKGEIYSWGTNNAGQLGNGDTTGTTQEDAKPISRGAIPKSVKITQIEAGDRHSTAIDANGKAYAWGLNTYGQLGNNDSTHANQFEPVAIAQGAIPAGVTITQISAGGQFTLALGSDQRAYSWGYGANGRLGTGNAANQDAPAAVAKGQIPASATVQQISAGDCHALLVSSDHKAYGWGVDRSSQLGIGRYMSNRGNPDIYSPLPVGIRQNFYYLVDVSYVPPTVSHVEAGINTSLAIGTDNRAYSWGDNTYGQGGLGINNSISDGTYGGRVDWPHAVLYLTGVTQASAGNAVALFVDSGGTHSCGNPSEGRLASPNAGIINPGLPGMGLTVQNFPVPVWTPTFAIVNVSFAGTPVASHTVDAAGNWHFPVPTHAVGKVDVTVDWNNVYDKRPQPPVTLHYDYRTTYTVSFKLGGGTSSPPPNQNVTNGDAIAWPETPSWEHHWFNGWFTSAGQPWDFTEGVESDMTLTAQWEDYEFTRTPGTGPTSGNTHVSVTAPAPPTGIRYFAFSAGDSNTLALASDGYTYAWGSNQYGQLGNEQAGSSSSHPVRVQLPEGVHLAQISTGYAHNIGLDTNGHVWTWGWNKHGQLGSASKADTDSPTYEPIDLTDAGALPATISQISAGYAHNMALDSDGNVWTWGWNKFGQLASTVNNYTDSANPTPVNITDNATLPISTINQISAGAAYSMVLDSDHHIWTWGLNNCGQLGTATNNSLDIANPTPVDLAAAGRIPDTITRVSAGLSHALALDSTNHVWTWGWNDSGQLGFSPTGNRANPNPYDITAVGILPADISQISAGTWHSTAVDSNQHVWTWGGNQYGQLATAANLGSMTANPIPVDITAAGILPSGATKLQTGAGHTIALDSSYHGSTWGHNDSGQLGHETAGNSPQPTPKAISLQEISLTTAKFDTTPIPNPPTWNTSEEKWHITSPAHIPGQADIALSWTLGSHAQPDYILPYFYNYNLPEAGSIPLQRMRATLALSLGFTGSLVVAEISLYRRRKHGRFAKSQKLRKA